MVEVAFDKCEKIPLQLVNKAMGQGHKTEDNEGEVGCQRGGKAKGHRCVFLL